MPVLPSPEHPLETGDATTFDGAGQALTDELPGQEHHGIPGFAEERQSCEGAQQKSTCALAASVVRRR